MPHSELQMPYEVRLALAECFVARLKSKPSTPCVDWSAQARGVLTSGGLVVRLGAEMAITDAGRVEVLSWGALWPGCEA